MPQLRAANNHCSSWTPLVTARRGWNAYILQMNKRAYTEKEAAEYIGMSVSFLRKDRHFGQRDGRTPGPRWRKVGKRAVRYLKEDLDAWLDSFSVNGGERR